ncbi:MAG: tetratricopeptide repeat protein [Casimicrobiaceae bacterium]
MSTTPTDPAHRNDLSADAALADAHAAWTTGDRPRAIALLTAYAADAPGAAKVWARLGAYGLEAARNDDALIWLKNALARAPDDAASWTNLGTVSLRLARTDDAIEAFRQARSLDPSALSVHVNLGNALQQCGDIDGAVAALETARDLQPDSPEALNNLGNLYKEQGRLDAALAAYQQALHAMPTFRPAFSNLLAATKLSTRHSPDDIFALHRAYAAHFENDFRAGYVPATNAPDPERRLRVGYVSPDCHTALPAFVEPVLRSHDRAHFDVFAYFNNPQPPAALDRLGAVTARVMKGVGDGMVAQWIRDDRIDVLIDIAGHTGHNRLGVFGRKPAPVQVTWLDYLNTTGLDGIDCRLTDAVSDPPGASDALHSEALIRLAPAQWCWKPPDVEDPGPLPMLAAGCPTLGSFNQGSKLTDATLALWSRLLTAIPAAHLVIVGVPGGSAQARVRDAFGDAGARVRVLSRLDPDAFRREARGIDIALDPLPFSGATTTFEMLWQGVPVVTWPGATSPSRSTASLLAALDLRDWIARDEGGYIDIVQRALAAPDALGRLRGALPTRLRDSPLCDAAAFTHELEGALRDAWRTWCARKTRPMAAADISAAPTSTQAGLRRIDGDARLAGIDAALRKGNGAGAVDATRALADEFPEWLTVHRAYLQTLLAWAQGQPELVRQMFPPPDVSRRTPRISVVICSIDPRKFAAVTASYRQRFAGHSLEIIGVHDARSLAEGYNRAAAKATGDLLVFSHDDIELVTTDFAARLVAHLERHDGVGVAGASRITGPRWGHAGQRCIHGHILHVPPPNRAGALLMASGFQHPVCEGIQGLDGVFIAVQRHVWETHRFDADRYDGFHLYDLDFTWRASGAGARLAVALDLLLLHRSTGRYNAAWSRYAARFVAQAGLDPLAPPVAGGMQTRLETLEQIDSLRAALLHFRYGAPVG